MIRGPGNSNGPLDGIRVLDLTSVLMGPYCTQGLCDMGAEVIKIESPEGDTSRHIPPFKDSKTSGTFSALNRGKRCIVLDLKDSRGQAACLDLAKTCDVFIHSMRPEALGRLGLSYPRVAEANPGIVYCNLLGFGREGRYSGLAAYDDAIQAVCGLASLQEELIGRPAYLPTVLADKVTGITALYGILAALLHKERTGVGQEVDVPMFETMAAFVLVEHIAGYSFDPPVGRPVYKRLMAPNRRPCETLDGRLCVVAYNDKQWKNFARLAGREDLIEDPRFKSLSERSSNLDAWNDVMAEVIKTRTTADWLPALAAAGIPAMRVNSTEDLFTDPHLTDVGFFKYVQHPVDGALRMTSFPVRFARTPASFEKPAGQLGADTMSVLSEAGFSPERIAELKHAGIFRSAAAGNFE